MTGGRPGTARPSSSKPRIGLIIRQGWHFLRSYRRYAAIFVALSLIQIGVQVATPLLLGHITDQIRMVAPTPSGGMSTADAKTEEAVLAEPDKSKGAGGNLIATYLLWSALILGGIATVIAVRLCQSLLDVSMANGLRDRVFTKILHQPPEFFYANEPGSLTMIVNQMAVETQMTMRQMILDPIVQIAGFAMAASAIVFSFQHLKEHSAWVSWLVVGAVVVIAIVSPWAIGRLGGRLRQASTGLRDQNLALASLVNGAFTSPEEIQVFRAEDAFSKKQRAGLDAMRKAKIRQTLTMETINASNSMPNILVQVLFAGVAVCLAIRLPAQAGNAGSLVSIVLLVPQLMQPLQALSAYLVLVQSSWPNVERILGLLEEPDEESPVASGSPAVAPAETDYSLRAENLVFRYGPNLPPVFNHISFEVPARKITGLVARKGEGKTTFFRLMLRFYDPQEGQILVGGVPTSKLTRESVRGQVTMMSQFPAFFHDTLRENMRIAEAGATDAQIEALCRHTGIWPILSQNIGTEDEKQFSANPLDRQFAGGKALSGGQKKLLALTRCLLRSPAYLLLDEPTVGMDRLEEYGLIASLRLACAGKTVLVVNHDTEWLHQFCDHFIVLDKGKIVQRGGKEIAQQPGLFKDLLDAAKTRDAGGAPDPDPRIPVVSPAGGGGSGLNLPKVPVQAGQPGASKV